MKDRLSIHIENGESDVREAVTILRNGGTASQSGLVGITNAVYDEATESPILPATIFNVQSTGDSNIRFSSGPSKLYRSCIELLGVGNTRASGLHFSYDPSNDDAYIEDGGYGIPTVNPDAVDKTVADFSLIRPSGQTGMEFSHISLSERGYVSIGLTRIHEDRLFEANAPLTVAYMAEGHADSGTIAIHEQSSSPATTSNFGKIFVKPYTENGGTQALYFKDDSGVETNILNPSSGLVYGDTYGNTYGGWNAPGVRTGDADTRYNTYYGWGAGFHLGEAGAAECNTLIGYLTGSGLKPTSQYNTVVGCESLKGYTSSNRNIVIGDNNLSNDSTQAAGSIDDTIIIGRELYNSELPADGTLAIGQGATPLIIGKVTTPNKFVSIIDGYFSVVDSNASEFKVSSTVDGALSRNTIVVDIIDHDQTGSDYAEDSIKFNFSNADSLTHTLLHLDPRGGPLTNTPNYQTPASTTPYAQLDADFKLKGAIRFQDGTSLSGLSYTELFPIYTQSGINKVFQASNSTDYLVLDYSNLNLAGNVSNNIRTDNTFVAVQLEGTSSAKIGKMSLQGLADYIGSGVSTIAENCNVIISNPENELNINAGANARSVMIGCDVAFGCSGQYNSVMIGSYAGANATVSNPTLLTPFNNIFIGPSAGEGSNDSSYAICIGDSAGKNSDSSQDCVFIGNGAGLNSTLTSSIGIGKNALRGDVSTSEGGTGNIEIVAGLDDSQRFFYDSANLALSNRLAINKTIAGRTDLRNISIGDARLTPTAPLEVRYDDTVGHSSNPTVNGDSVIQSWYCNDNLVAYVNCDGEFVNDISAGNPSIVEGITSIGISAPTGIAAPTSGTLRIYNAGVDSGNDLYITNRDSTLTINTSSYVVAMKIGNEYRPIWVSC